MKYEKTLRRNGFDLLHKPGPTVHQYADRPGLFVLTAPLTSGSLSKKEFFDRLKNTREPDSRVFLYKYELIRPGPKWPRRS